MSTMQLSRDQLSDSNPNETFCSAAKKLNSCVESGKQDFTPIPGKQKYTPLASAQRTFDPPPVNCKTNNVVKCFQKTPNEFLVIMENNISTEHVNTLTAQSITVRDTAVDCDTSVGSKDVLPHIHPQFSRLMICDKPAHEQETLVQQHMAETHTQQHTPETLVQQHTAEAHTQQHTSETLVQKHTAKAHTQQHTSETLVQQHTAEAHTQQHTSETLVQKHTAKAHTQQHTPETLVQQHTAEAHTQQHTPETLVQQHTPETLVQQHTAEAHTQQHTPETLAQQHTAETHTQHHTPETLVQQQISKTDTVSTLPGPTSCQELTPPCQQLAISSCNNAVNALPLSTEAEALQPLLLSENQSCQEAMVLDDIKGFLHKQSADTTQYEQPKLSLGLFKAFSVQQNQVPEQQYSLHLFLPFALVSPTGAYHMGLMIEMNPSTILFHIFDINFFGILCEVFLLYLHLLVASNFFLEDQSIENIPTGVFTNGDDDDEDVLSGSGSAPECVSYPLGPSNIQNILKEVCRSPSDELESLAPNEIHCQLFGTENLVPLSQPQHFFSKKSSAEMAVSCVTIHVFLHRKLTLASKQEQADATEPLVTAEVPSSAVNPIEGTMASTFGDIKKFREATSRDYLPKPPPLFPEEHVNSHHENEIPSSAVNPIEGTMASTFGDIKELREGTSRDCLPKPPPLSSEEHVNSHHENECFEIPSSAVNPIEGTMASTFGDIKELREATPRDCLPKPPPLSPEEHVNSHHENDCFGGGEKDHNDTSTVFEDYEGVLDGQKSTEREDGNGTSHCTPPDEMSCQNEHLKSGKEQNSLQPNRRKKVSGSQIPPKRRCKTKQTGSGKADSKGHHNRSHARQSKSSTTNRQFSGSTPRQGGGLCGSGGSGRDGDDDGKDWKRKPNKAHIPPPLSESEAEESKTNPRPRRNSSEKKTQKLPRKKLTQCQLIPSTSTHLQKPAQLRPSSPPINSNTPRNRETESNSLIGCSRTSVSQQGASGVSKGDGDDSDGDSTHIHDRDLTHQATTEKKYADAPLATVTQTISKASEHERGLDFRQSEFCDINRISAAAAPKHRKTYSKLDMQDSPNSPFSVNLDSATEETSTHLKRTMVVSHSVSVIKRADYFSCHRGGGTSLVQAGQVSDDSTDESETSHGNPTTHPESNSSSLVCDTPVESSQLASSVRKEKHIETGQQVATSTTHTSGYVSRTQPECDSTSQSTSESLSYDEGEKVVSKPKFQRQSSSSSSSQAEFVTGKRDNLPQEDDQEQFPHPTPEIGNGTIVKSGQKESSSHTQFVNEESSIHPKGDLVTLNSKFADDTSELESFLSHAKVSKGATNNGFEDAVPETSNAQSYKLVTLASPPSPPSSNIEASYMYSNEAYLPSLSDIGAGKVFTSVAGHDLTASLITLLPGHGHGENNAEPDGITNSSKETSPHPSVQFYNDPPTLVQQGTQKYFNCCYPPASSASTDCDKGSTSERDSETSSWSGASSCYRWSRCVQPSNWTNCCKSYAVCYVCV